MEASLSPYIMYCTPKSASQNAWNVPQALNAHGIDVDEVKNQNIFIVSPTSQLTRTESRSPLLDRDRIFTKICGMGNVASIERPTSPINGEYDWYTQGRGASRSSQATRPMNRHSKNCQYLHQTSASPCLYYVVWDGNPRLRRPPLPEIEGPLRLVHPGKRNRRVAPLRIWRGPVFQGDLQQDRLHSNHDAGLDEKRTVVSCTGVIKDSERAGLAGADKAR